MTQQYFIQIKAPAVKALHTLIQGFGTHLMPVFYSGSIDLVLQNLLIVMLGKIAPHGQMKSLFFGAKKCLSSVVVTISTEFSDLQQLIKIIRKDAPLDKSLMMLKITPHGVIQICTSSIYHAFHKCHKSKLNDSPAKQAA